MGFVGDSPGAMVILPADAALGGLEPMQVATCFDLTPVQGQVLASLATHTDIKVVARVLNFSLHNARNHLRQIMDKMGVKTQKELLHQMEAQLTL